MRCHRSVMLALLVSIATGAGNQYASAQQRASYRFAQNTPAAPTRAPVEELPTNQQSAGPMTSDSGSYVQPGFSPALSDSCWDGSCDSCNSCYSDDCGDSCGACGCGSGGWCGLGNGSWFVTADYLAVRAHFSDALSYVSEVDTNDPQATTRNYHQLDFDYKSSFRIGGGYRLCCCGEEIVFNYTQLRSDADGSVDGGQRFSGTRIELPFNPNPTNASPLDPFLGTTQSATIRSSVDVDTYDLEWRKTIPLGGTSCSGCGNACGCGNGCGSCCPAWDITWSGGVRGASVDWDRRYVLTDTDVPENDTDTKSSLRFNGAGPRFGVEGRRYFGHDGWFSVFMKGDISLLFGTLDLNTTQTTTINSSPNLETELFRHTQIIPVTEIEAGLTATLTCHSTISGGYMLSAWHDLGMRDEPVLGQQVLDQTLVSSYDDANILSFDGFFARYEWAY